MVRRLDALTGLRAVAALVVYLYHAGLFPWGYAGVDLFFCLSGFVLTINYTAQLQQLTVQSYLCFMKARLARIWPVHAATFLLTLPYYVMGGGALSWEFVAKSGLTLTLTHTLSPKTVWAFNEVSWSLSNEFLFYAAFPLLIAHLLPRLSSARRLQQRLRPAHC